jgi:hypothetical protein
MAADPRSRTHPLRRALESVLLIICPKSRSKGSAFLLESGAVVTAAHVVAGTRPRDIVGVNAGGDHVAFSKVVVDDRSDLALLRPTSWEPGGLTLATGPEPDLGAPLWAWGFPFGYLGPKPLLTVGYVAGYKTVTAGRRRVRHLVVNGAFNMGNSGGPVCEPAGMSVVGVVVNKQVPRDPFVESALAALAQQKAGPQFTAVNPRGLSKQMAESELVAEIFSYYGSYLQVMLGEAIALRELRRFLAAHEPDVRPRVAR